MSVALVYSLLHNIYANQNNFLKINWLKKINIKYLSKYERLNVRFHKFWIDKTHFCSFMLKFLACIEFHT